MIEFKNYKKVCVYYLRNQASITKSQKFCVCVMCVNALQKYL